MTTIILVTIGILLAAVAALFTIFYGGDAFTSGSVGARADALQNVGHNVSAAARVYHVTNDGIPESYTSLASGTQYLRAPTLGDGEGTIEGDWRTLSGASGTDVTAFVVKGVPDDVCHRLNRDLRGNAAIPTQPGGPYGCVSSADGNLYYAAIAGSGAATAADPGGGTTTPPATANWVACGGEGGPCNIPGRATARFGVPGAWITKSNTASVSCSISSFGSDPAQDQGKSCEYDANTLVPLPPSNWQTCAGEHGTCQFYGTATVRFGAGVQYSTRTVTASINCDTGSFGGDPAPGQVKTCEIDQGSLTPPASGSWYYCGGENETCSFSGTRQVRYGANGSYRTLTATGPIGCSSGTFGGDPAPGVAKACETVVP